MSYNMNLDIETVDRIVNNIVATVPTNAIYLFKTPCPGEKKNINVYIVTDDNNNDTMDYEAAVDVIMSLRWLDKSMTVFCLSSGEFLKRSRRAKGLEKTVIDEGRKIYEKPIS